MKIALTSTVATSLNKTILAEGSLRTAIGITSFVLLTALGGQVALPLSWTPVPVTLQVVFVLLSGAVLGWRAGAISQVLYLAAGVAGAPIFAMGMGGPWSLIGPTAGYLLAFPLGAAAAGLVAARIPEGSFWLRSSGYMGAAILILLIGAAWFGTWMGGGITAVFVMGIAPFLPGAAVKALLVAGLSPTGRRRWMRGSSI